MTDEVDLPDPYRPDATPAERAEALIGQLLLDDNPVRRYDTIRALQGGALREAAAITLLQLRAEHGTTEAAADAVGITRQAATELLDKAGAPGAREQRRRQQEYAYLYGRYLAAIQAAAISADQAAAARRPDIPDGRAEMSWLKLEPHALTSTAAMRRLDAAAGRWLRAIRSTQARRARQNAITEAVAALAGWDAIERPRHLTLAERSDAYLGLHAARVEARRP